MASRTAVVALLVGALAFGGSFAAARALSGEEETSEPRAVQRLPDTLVTISNLERAPSIKPLRSIAGAPPPAQTEPTP